MAEETEGQETGAGASGAGVDPSGVGIAVALDEARSHPALKNKVEAFLDKHSVLADKQGALIDDQRHHLREQFKQLRLSIWEKRTGVLLRAATTIVGVAVAGFFALMVWDAARSSGLIVEPFAVPADMAANGLTGQVVASQMLDKLSAMQAANYSSRPLQPYENNWGDNLKVEIPETGVSIGELQQFLKDWLGHDTHITGEVYRTGAGIAVTAREGSEAGATFTGPESDLDKLMQQAAEHVYSVTQPFRYANYLDRDLGAPDIADRAARAAVIYRKLIAGSNVQEQAWGWYGLAFIERFVKPDHRASRGYHLKAVAANPDFTLSHYNLANGALGNGRYEEGLSNGLVAKRLLDRRTVPDIDSRQLRLRQLFMAGDIAEYKGDFAESLRNRKAGTEAPEYFDNAALGRNNFVAEALTALADLHDGGGIRVLMRDEGVSSIPQSFNYGTAMYIDWALADWPSLLQIEKDTPANVLRLGYLNNPEDLAMVALAHAQTGDTRGAETLIAPCPSSSDDCVIARGQITEVQGDHAAADGWFAQAEKAEPSIPFGDTAWGQALLERSNPDAAIAKFTLASKKGPHFADPLEGWGEALMAKNQSHLALAKFAESEKYAPNWGRLHLKWGEALAYVGKKEDAAKEFSKAATLDLAPGEKSELERMKP